jgi:hypothetical protein
MGDAAGELTYGFHFLSLPELILELPLTSKITNRVDANSGGECRGAHIEDLAIVSPEEIRLLSRSGS